MPISAIVFDFDGVLANSEPLHLRAYQEVLSQIGLALDRDEYYARYLGFDDIGALRAIARERGKTWTDREVSALVARKTVVFDQMIASAEVLYPTAVACVERLAARLPLGIASGALRHEIEAVLRSSGLDRHIRFIVAAGDTPSSKPAPDPYRTRRPAARPFAVGMRRPRRFEMGDRIGESGRLAMRGDHAHLSGERARDRRRGHRLAGRIHGGTARSARLNRRSTPERLLTQTLNSFAGTRRR